MPKIRIRELHDLTVGACDENEVASGGVTTYPMFASSDDRLHARFHDLAAGSSVGWKADDAGYVIYMWRGMVEVGDIALPEGSAFIVEHGAHAQLYARGDATILVFNQNRVGLDPPVRPGGRVHLLPAERVPAAARVNENLNVGGALYADSECPTCELWLHGNDFHDPECSIPNHFHSEDEIIMVTGGEIMLGSRRYGRGTGIAITRNTVYGFKTGSEGLSFINFRPSRPTYGMAQQSETSDERKYYSSLPSPDYINL